MSRTVGIETVGSVIHVDKLATLSSLDRSAYPYGTFCYVAELKKYYSLQQTGTPSGQTVIDTGQSAFWVQCLDGTTISAGAAVATPANVAAVATVDPGGALATGAPIFVQSVRSTYTLDRTSALTADSITVVPAAAGGGQWLRTTSSHKSWSQQQSWFLDGSAGNDKKTSEDTSNKIQTAEEICPRFG